MLVVQILAFLEKKVTISRKNLKMDNFSYSIKKQSKQNKELKYRRKNIVCNRYQKKVLFAHSFSFCCILSVVIFNCSDQNFFREPDGSGILPQ